MIKPQTVKDKNPSAATSNPSMFKKEVEKVEGAKILDCRDVTNPEPNSTGSFSLDFDLVVPVPEGRITEIYGGEGAGKSSLALEIIGQALKKGKKALYVNMERNLNRSLLETIRSVKPFINWESTENSADAKFSIMFAPDGETALELCRKWCITNPGSILVLDSIDACVPAAILAGEIGESHIGNHAKLMSQGIRALNIAVEENKVAFVCINQWRSKMTSYGDPRTTSGGNAIAYYATQRIEVQKPGKAEMITTSDGTILGFNVRYRVIKNKCAPQGQEGQLPILFYNGIYRELEIINMSAKFGLIQMGGKGGQQVLLPILDADGKETADHITCSKFNAARRLLNIDKKLADIMAAKLIDFLSKSSTATNAIETDEVSES
jgi:recombination protein RecA